MDSDLSSNTASTFAEAGDIVEISVLGSHSTHDTVKNCFDGSIGENGYLKFRGSIAHIWVVHHSKRKEAPDFEFMPVPALCQRENDIVRSLSFISYTSPSDVVTAEVPDLPSDHDEDGDIDDEFNAHEKPKKKNTSPQMAEAIKKKRVALKERAEQVRNAWLDWKKPILKPSDVVALIRPSGTGVTDNRHPFFAW